MRNTERITIDQAHYNINDGRSVHHSIPYAYQLQLELVLLEVVAANHGSSHISVAVDLVRDVFKVRLNKVSLKDGNNAGIRFL